MKESFYKYGKIMSWIIIFLILFLYFIFYFFPSIKTLKVQRQSFHKNTNIITRYKEEIKTFKEPTEEEKLLWKKIAEKTKEKIIFLNSEKQLLSFLSKNIENLKNTLEKIYDDFLINIKEENIKITQTLKNDSDLTEVFKSITDSASLKNNTANSFVAYRQNPVLIQQGEQNMIKIKLLFASSLRKTSLFLYDLFSKFSGFSLDKLIIVRKGNKTFHLLILKVNIKKGYSNVKK